MNTVSLFKISEFGDYNVFDKKEIEKKKTQWKYEVEV